MIDPLPLMRGSSLKFEGDEEYRKGSPLYSIKNDLNSHLMASLY